MGQFKILAANPIIERFFVLPRRHHQIGAIFVYRAHDLHANEAGLLFDLAGALPKPFLELFAK
jgi:hypothetical protein